jgi:Cyanate lyase C-terminal domain
MVASLDGICILRPRPLFPAFFPRSLHITREPDPKGDRVHIVMSGTFLPYKMY